jgi:hypothetical protein
MGTVLSRAVGSMADSAVVSTEEVAGSTGAVVGSTGAVVADTKVRASWRML